MSHQTDFTHRIEAKDIEDYSFDIGPMGPPGEQGSLLLRITRNCPWNRCLFCTAYKSRRFEYKEVEEVKRDIDIVKALENEIVAACREFGRGDGLNENLVATSEVIEGITWGNPEIYGPDVDPETRRHRITSLCQVAYWLNCGARNVFLQDANSLIMRVPELTEALRYLKERFPSIERVSSYARSKTCYQRSVDDLKVLREAGLSSLRVGLESGCDDVLEFMQKGVTSEQHVKGCRNVVESGISLSVYVMPGLGGRKWSKAHVLQTAQVVSDIDPDFIRIRTLALLRDSPLSEKCKAGEFESLTEDEMVEEIGTFIENLSCHSYILSDQMTNLLPEIEGQLPQEKGKLLTTIQQYQVKPLMERLTFKLDCYAGAYCGYLARRGRFDSQLGRLIEEARRGIQEESPEADAKVEEAIQAIKGRGVP